MAKHAMLRHTEKNVRYMRIVVAMALTCLWMAFAAGVIGLFSPMWITLEIPVNRMYIGLVVYCSYPRAQSLNAKDDCTWFKPGQVESPEWLIATRILVATSCGLMFLTTFSFLFLCGRKFQNPECSSFIITGTFLSSATMTCAVIMFGVRGHRDYQAAFLDRENPVYMDWGYFLAVVSAGLSIFSLITICTMVYFTSNSDDSGRRLMPNGDFMGMEQKRP